MRFTYKITLELTVDFDAPLLGADTTIFRRSQADKLFKENVKELLVDRKQTINTINKVIKEENFDCSIVGSKHIQTKK